MYPAAWVLQILYKLGHTPSKVGRYLRDFAGLSRGHGLLGGYNARQEPGEEPFHSFLCCGPQSFLDFVLLWLFLFALCGCGCRRNEDVGSVHHQEDVLERLWDGFVLEGT